MKRLLAELRDDLTPNPERQRLIARIVITTALVVIISTALDIPFIAVSAYMVFFVSKADPATTFRTAIAFIVGMTVSIPLTIVLFIATVDDPPLRYAGMAAVLFVGMWLSRITALGPLAFVLGFVICVTQAVVDDSLVPELFVRAAMWLWVAIVYAVGLTAVANFVILPADPARRFIADWARWTRALAGQSFVSRPETACRPSAVAGIQGTFMDSG